MEDDGTGVLTFGAAQTFTTKLLRKTVEPWMIRNGSVESMGSREGSCAGLLYTFVSSLPVQRSLLKIEPPSTDVDLRKNQRFSMLEAWCGKGAHQSGPRGDLISELASSWQVDPAIRKRRNEGTRLPTKKVVSDGIKCSLADPISIRNLKKYSLAALVPIRNQLRNAA